jgi:GGDEF domain-containing protein
MALDAPHRRPGRPVADAPIERLLARPEDVARNWMFALLSQVELHQAPGVITEPFTRDGPRVCDAALRALVEDADLRRLARDGALWPLVSRVGEMTGSPAPGHVLRAVDALQDVLWTALRGELRGAADPDLVADLAARLTRVCALIRDAGLMRAGGGGGLELEPEHRDAPADVEPPIGPDVDPDPEPDPDPGPAAARAAGGVAALETEPAAAPRSPRRSTPLWVGALEDEIQAAKAAFAPLALLLTELEDADRLAAAAGPERAGEAFGEFSLAVRRVLRGQDILVQETPSRAWVIARETTRAAAHSLGARIAESVGETSSLSGTPLVASVGIAVLSEDGIERPQLMEAAEEARFAASARGIEVSRRMR